MTRSELRAALLRAAEREISANGLAKASLRAIARRCGVSHQATTHYFSDRAGLFTALAVEGFESLTREMAEAAGAAPAEGGLPLAAASIAYLTFSEQHATTFDVMYRPELHHPEDASLEASKRAVWELVTTLVAEAQARGWGRGLPPEETALTAWSSMHGLAMMRRDPQLARVLPSTEFPAMVQVLARALNPVD